MSAAPNLKDALKYRIKVERGPLAGQTFNFEQTTIHIGRGTENDLVLTNDLKASRQHAEIRWDGFELHIVNLSKKNFLGVNGQQVQSAKLDSGAIILIGESEFIIEFDQESKTQIRDSEKLTPPTPASPVGATPYDSNVLPVHINSNPIQYQPPITPASVHDFSNAVLGGAISNQSNYSTNIPGAQIAQPMKSRFRPRPRASGKESGRFGFYVVVAILGFGFWWLMSPSNTKKKELTYRSTEQIEQEIQASREELKEFEARKEKLDNIQFKRAQENYIRGFRDYKQGNYGRARESFQVVLNLDPGNELAKRYYHLSKVKFDELVKFHMLQGNRYREKKNWRMCKASYFNVMTMLNNNQDPVFKEAKQYYDQCSLAEEGRF